MRKTKPLGRLLSLVLAALMVLGLCFLPTPAKAADKPNIGSGHTALAVTIKTKDVTNAGTDADITLYVYYLNGKSDHFLLDEDDYNDFEQGKTHTYDIYVEKPFYYIKSFGLYNDGSHAAPDWVVERVDISAYAVGTTFSSEFIKTVTLGPGTYKIDAEEEYKFNNSGYRRDFSDAFNRFGGVDETSNTNNLRGYFVFPEYVDPYEYSAVWHPDIEDGIFKRYNCYLYPGAPKYEFNVSAAANGSEAFISKNTDYVTNGKLLWKHKDKDRISSSASYVNYEDGFSFNTGDLQSRMKEDDYFALKVVSTLSFPDEGSSSTADYFIFRNEFELADQAEVAPLTYYYAANDNYYYNCFYRDIVLYLPVVTDQKHINYNSREIAENMGASEIKLYFGPGENDWISGHFDGVVVEGGQPKAVLKFDASEVDYENLSGSGGLKLYLKGVSSADATYSSSGSEHYNLYSRTSFDQGSARKVTLGGKSVTLSENDYYCDLSLYKLDTVKPEITVEEQGVTGGASFSGNWKQDVSLVTWPKNVTSGANETLYVDGSEGYIELSLEKTNGSGLADFYVINDNNTTSATASAQLIPSLGGRVTRIALAPNQEEALNVKVRGADFAGNEYTYTYPSAVYLDNMAPRISLFIVPQDQAVDGSKSVYFTFPIQEGSKTGRINYCFVSGTGDPPAVEQVEPTSGVIEHITGNWAFVNQDPGQDTVTVVLKLSMGESFDGTIWYFAEDAAGNSTNRYSESFSIKNQKAEARILVKDYDHNLPEYDVSFTYNSDCTVSYRYAKRNDNGTYTPVTDYAVYDPNGTNPGDPRIGNTLLDGSYVLEYIVTNTVSGNVDKHEGAMGHLLTFDNSPPRLAVTRITTGSSLESQSLRLTAEDYSGIVSARYEVKVAGTGDIAAAGNLQLPDGGEVLSTELSTLGMELPNGAYAVTLYATDRNQTTASLTGDTFTVRSQPPTAEIAINGAPVSDLVGIKDPGYTLELNVTDSFTGTPGSQRIFWRASSDGIGYTAWQKLSEEMIPGSGVLTAAASITAPMAVEEGPNTIRFEILCAENSKNPNTEDISPNSILRLDPVYILLDVHAPTAAWSATSGRNRTELTGTLTVLDDYAPAPTVTPVTSGVTVTPAKGRENTYDVAYTLPAGGAKPDKLVLNITDGAGNVNAYEIPTDLLDIEGPRIAIGAPAYRVYGDRQDALFTVTVTEEYPGTVDVELDPAASAVVDQISDGVYTVLLQGYNGDMPFTFRATDDLGNASSAVSGTAVVKTGTIAEPQIVSEPAYAYDSALTILRYNLPAAAAATEEEALALAKDAKLNGINYLQGCALLIPDVLGEGKQTCTVWVADAFGNTRCFTLTPNTIFGKDIPMTVSLEQYLDGVKAAGKPDMLISGTHIADPSDPTDSTREYTARVVVEAAAGGDPHALFPYTILTGSDDRSGSTMPILEPDEGDDPPKTRIDYCDPEDYDAKDALLAFLAQSPETELDPYGLCLDPFDVSFSRMTFEVCRGEDVTENVSSATLNIGAYMRGEPVEEDAETAVQAVFIRLPYADRMSFSGTYTITGDTAPYTLAAGISNCDIWLNRTLKLDLPIIAAAPQITFDYQQNTIAPEVSLIANGSGRGVDLQLMKLLKQEPDGSWTAAAVWTAGDGTSGPTIQHIIPAEEAGVYRLYAVNVYGLSTLTEPFEVTVFSEPIDETDYTLRLYAEVNGVQVPVTGEEPYSNAVTARIELTAEGVERGLYAANCASLETLLTPGSSSFAFQLMDMYGYTLQVTVSYSRFDTTAPKVEYTLPDVGKTNQAYSVTITAEDTESGIGLLTFAGPTGTLVLEEQNGVWTGRITENGTYLITAEDKLGNRTLRSFTVSNIDMNLPTATITRSVPEGVWTLQPVTVSLSFDKPNVLITKVEKASGELTQNKTNKTLTFSTNGAATVFFRDDYGNEGSVLVTVNNIYTEPPRLAAVPTLSEDELSVSVTFEMERGADGAPLDLVRDLSQLTVIHNSVAYRADEAVYLLRDNGTYTFTVIDDVGLMQVIKLTVSDIDRSAPRITEVRWTYVYYDSEGREHNATYNLSSIQGAGYRIASDLYPMTNQNVTVTVTTDVPTAIMGSYGSELSTDHTLVYYQNGMYIYNLEKRNGLSEHYGVDVEIIDKTPPTITLENPEYLMFIENRDTGDFTDMLNDYTASDTYLGVTTDLTGEVTVDYGGLIVDDLSRNTFDKSHPFTVTYSVKDAAGNEIKVTRTVVLIGINDVLVTVNGRLPSASSMAESRDGSVKLELVNFSGVSYVTYAKGMYTFGQMKRTGTLVPPQADGSFQLNNLPDGWYTFFIQTETRDYFNLYVYVG